MVTRIKHTNAHAVVATVSACCQATKTLVSTIESSLHWKHTARAASLACKRFRTKNDVVRHKDVEYHTSGET